MRCQRPPAGRFNTLRTLPVGQMYPTHFRRKITNYCRTVSYSLALGPAFRASVRLSSGNRVRVFDTRWTEGYGCGSGCGSGTGEWKDACVLLGKHITILLASDTDEESPLLATVILSSYQARLRRPPGGGRPQFSSRSMNSPYSTCSR